MRCRNFYRIYTIIIFFAVDKVCVWGGGGTPSWIPLPWWSSLKDGDRSNSYISRAKSRLFNFSQASVSIKKNWNISRYTDQQKGEKTRNKKKKIWGVKLRFIWFSWFFGVRCDIPSSWKFSFLVFGGWGSFVKMLCIKKF